MIPERNNRPVAISSPFGTSLGLQIKGKDVEKVIDPILERERELQDRSRKNLPKAPPKADPCADALTQTFVYNPKTIRKVRVFGWDFSKRVNDIVDTSPTPFTFVATSKKEFFEKLDVAAATARIKILSALDVDDLFDPLKDLVKYVGDQKCKVNTDPAVTKFVQPPTNYEIHIVVEVTWEDNNRPGLIKTGTLNLAVHLDAAKIAIRPGKS